MTKQTMRDAAGELMAAVEEALDLFAPTWCYLDGRVITLDDQPFSAEGAWVLRARAALAMARGDGDAQA